MDREYQGTLEVCNRRSDQFEGSQPIQYTQWIREKNGYSGSNSFRKATRLIKYIRDIKRRFSCPSVLLTTLIGRRIEWFDKNSGELADTPSALQTIMRRLDDWLQAHPDKPKVLNPALETQDFADLWNDTQYANFRNFVNKYRNWVDEAVAAETRADSIEKWRKIFGDEFAKGENVKRSEAVVVQRVSAMLMETAAHLDSLVDSVVDFGVSILPARFKTPTHLRQPPWEYAHTLLKGVQITAEYANMSSGRRHAVQSGEALPRKGGLWFDVRVNKFQPVSPDCYLRWRIANTGAIAIARGMGRGGFEYPTEGNRRWESLSYRGVHMAEAFVIRRHDNRIVGYSEPFYVVIK